MNESPDGMSRDDVIRLRHDLRTPLNHIIGYGEMLQEELAESAGEQTQADMGRILQASRHLLAMLNAVVEPEQIQLLKRLPDLKKLSEGKEINPTLLTKDDLDIILPKIQVEESRETGGEAHVPANVLIVDDERQNCDLLARRLAQEGYRAVSVYSGQEALDQLRSDPTIDIVLLDVLMPGMDGYEVLLKIKGDEKLRHVPVIMISALDQLESVVRCIQHGAVDYLGKPFNLTFLRARLGSSLERKRLRDQEQRMYTELQKTQEALLIEQEKSEMLLLNMLPKAVANQLREGNRTIAEHYSEATILFADLVNFTVLAEAASPMEVVELLNELFLCFDELADRHGVEKIKTIGDCYMAAAGVPVPRPDHASVLVDMALDMQESVNALRFRGKPLGFRVGINSGSVVAGVIGRKKFIYDLWGDAVNTASRMESHGAVGAVQISESTHELVRDDFVCKPQGRMEIKGKGAMEVWHVIGRREKTP